MEQRVRVCDINVKFRCSEARLSETIDLVFGGLPADNSSAPPTLAYTLGREPITDVLTICRDGSQPRAADSIDELLFLLDKDLILELQRRRPDLFFVHAGIVVHDGGAWALSAPSGTGKSTIVWALLSEGLRYASDELAPIERVGSEARVHPYPRALNLKREPSPPYALPPGVPRFAQALYIPTSSMALAPQADALPLRGFLFLRREQTRTIPRVTRLTPAEAATHLYSNALNALAHVDMGLDSAIAIVRSLPCFAVEAGSVSATVTAVHRCIKAATE